ncbi:MAG: twin-arginine translocase TatA/TatE family subunit [Deltaproteobacteria bacterium]|nr:twin-arginine translocase TatA/TatE family subunit [Deltaproteobacteria bacterium]
MFGLGMTEMLVILAIVVLIFGSKKLPQVGDGLGKMITNFRRSIKSVEPEKEASEQQEKKKEEIET